MDWLLIVILAIVQGITEFLPISSDGHLVVAAAVLRGLTQRDFPNSMQLTLALHAGTLAATTVVFWPRIVRLLRQDRRVVGLIALGTLPVIASGLALSRWAEGWLQDELLTGCLLLLNGLMLFWADRTPEGKTDYADLSWWQAVKIGAAQALAPLPGLSRSGTTICAGLRTGLRREAAATFSFLLALPAVGLACGYELFKFCRADEPPSHPWPQLLVGVLVSFAVGVVALRWLLIRLQRGSLRGFGWWCIGVGLVVIALQLRTTLGS